MKQFVQYYLDHVDELSVKGGYDPPTAEDRKANAEALAKLFPAAGASGFAGRPRGRPHPAK